MHLPGTEFSAATVVSAVKRRSAIHDQQGVPEIGAINGVLFVALSEMLVSR